MNLNPYFKSVLDQDRASIVLCGLDHTILYMNPAAIRSYAKHGGAALVGRSLANCHNAHSNEMIQTVVDWFAASPEHNLIYTYHNEKQNKDVYMVALRDEDGTLIGYYEKHEYRDPETMPRYDFTCGVFISISGQGALQTSITKKALPGECLFRCCGYLFSFSCSSRSFLIRFFSLSTRGQGQEKPSLALHQRVSG